VKFSRERDIEAEARVTIVLGCRRTEGGLCGRRGRVFDTWQNRRPIAAEITDDWSRYRGAFFGDSIYFFDTFDSKVGKRTTKRKEFCCQVPRRSTNKSELFSEDSEKVQQVRKKSYYNFFYYYISKSLELDFIKVIRCRFKLWSIFLIVKFLENYGNNYVELY